MPKHFFPRRRFIAAACAIVVSVAAIAVYGGFREKGPFAGMEAELLNWRFAVRGPLRPSPRVALVIIDDKSISALKGWPVSRKVIGDAVNRISQAGAKAIAIDLVLTASGRKIDPAGDNALLGAIGAHGGVVLPLAFQFRRDDGRPPPRSVTGHAFKSVIIPPGAPPIVPVQPVGVLAPSSAYLAVGRAGHVNFFVSVDGSVRHAQLALPFGRDHYPALPLELARLVSDTSPNQLSAILNSGIRLGDRFIETDRLMRIGVNYLGPSATIPRVSLIDVLDGKVGKRFFAGKAVLIGVEASGVGDAFGSPFERRFAGVALLATVTDNLIENRWLRRGDRGAAIDLAILAVTGILVATLLAFGLAGPALISIAVAAVLIPVSAQFAFELSHLWLNLAFPLIQLLALAAICGSFLLFGEHRARRKAEARSNALGRFVSPLVQHHLDQPKEAGGMSGGSAENEDVRTVMALAMFVDVRGFTRLSQDLPPAEVAAWMRRFHRHVEDTVVRFGGVVDKYIGDGVLALFGVMGASPTDAAQAIECAEVLGGRRGPSPSGADGIRLAVGLHMGPVAIEVMGGSERAEVSAAGDTVNVASRLQGLTRDLDVDVVTSEAVIEAARAGSVREFDRWRLAPPQELRGREGQISIRTWAADASGADENPANPNY